MNKFTIQQLQQMRESEDRVTLYCVSRGESIRNVDSVTLKKLLSQELFIETSDRIRLTPLYE